jgi:glucose-1-phosphate thymidylyltransferase
MKGIILAGGKGTRVYPLTEVVPKSLLPVYDKPLIYYPLTTLLQNGIKEILIISNPDDLPSFRRLLGTGSRFGVSFRYKPQSKPKGIPDAFIIGKNFIKKDNTVLILGDNLFYGESVVKKAIRNFKSGATIFAYEVINPNQYGVVEFNSKNNVLSIEEKPLKPKSKYAIPGLYIYDNDVLDIAAKVQPSKRGELEISDVNRHYLNNKKLFVYKLNRGSAWLDAGSHESLVKASEYVRTIEERQGIKIGCPEEAALKSGLIDKVEFLKSLDKMPNTAYKEYLTRRK